MSLFWTVKDRFPTKEDFCTVLFVQTKFLLKSRVSVVPDRSLNRVNPWSICDRGGPTKSKSPHTSRPRDLIPPSNRVTSSWIRNLGLKVRFEWRWCTLDMSGLDTSMNWRDPDSRNGHCPSYRHGRTTLLTVLIYSIHTFHDPIPHVSWVTHHPESSRGGGSPGRSWDGILEPLWTHRKNVPGGLRTTIYIGVQRILCHNRSKILYSNCRERVKHVNSPSLLVPSQIIRSI